jgi:adenosylhomocysteine nucleosidase
MDYLIISAMPIELNYIKQKLDHFSHKLGQRTIDITSDGKIGMMAVGVGKVNAAASLQLLIDTYAPKFVINTGIAGGIAENLSPLDVVVGSSYTYHDVRLAQMKQLFPYQSEFLADATLLSRLTNIKQGKIISGENFIESEADKIRLIETYHPVAVDMESAALAHVAFLNQTPFIAIRAISDMADDDTGETYSNFEEEASIKAGEVCLKLIDFA